MMLSMKMKSYLKIFIYRSHHLNTLLLVMCMVLVLFVEGSLIDHVLKIIQKQNIIGAIFDHHHPHPLQGIVTNLLPSTHPLLRNISNLKTPINVSLSIHVLQYPLPSCDRSNQCSNMRKRYHRSIYVAHKMTFLVLLHKFRDKKQIFKMYTIHFEN